MGALPGCLWSFEDRSGVRVECLDKRMEDASGGLGDDESSERWADFVRVGFLVDHRNQANIEVIASEGC